MGNQELNQEKIIALEKRITTASDWGIWLGILGIAGSVLFGFLVISNPIWISSFGDLPGLLINFVTCSFSLIWGLQIKKDKEKRLIKLTHLTGVYVFKFSLLLIGMLVTGPRYQNLRFVVLVLALIFIIRGRNAEKIIAKANQKTAILKKAKISIIIWIVFSVLFFSLNAMLATLSESIESPAEKLVIALETHDSQAVTQAIAEGADPNMKILGKPLFHLGVYDIFYLKTLLDNGVDINIKSSYGRTALHEAALHGKVEIVKLLLENGADVNAKNNRGETPLFYAEGGIIAGPKMTENHKKVAELLKKYGGVKLGRRPFSRR